MGNIIKWIQGNPLKLAIPLQKVTITEQGKVTEPYIPNANETVKVVLSSTLAYRVRAYEFTPTVIDGNVVTIQDNGEMATGQYDITVLIKNNTTGEPHRSKWKYLVEIYDDNSPVVEEFDDFPDYGSGEIVDAAVVYFAKGDPFTYEDFTQEQINDLKKPAVDAAAEVAQLESQIQTAEAGRVTAEAGRVSNEDTRNVNEEAREGRETVRENNETDRERSETTRLQSESDREQAERGRVASETNREEAEAQRESASAAAVRAANAAAANANDKAALADSKATLAGEKAGLAGEKAGLADTKAALADEKAALADEKATEASNVVAVLTTGGGAVMLTVTNRQGASNTKEVGFRIYKTYDTVAAMNADAANVDEGRFVMIAGDVEQPDTGKLYVKGASSFTYITDLSGAQGIKGDAFTYADFTPEEIAGLQRPATEAAATANAAAANANTKAALADTKAQAADTAAQNAQTKATLADQKATEAGRVNATVSGTVLTVTDRNGVSMSVDTKGEKGNDVAFEMSNNGHLIVVSDTYNLSGFAIENQHLIITM